MLLFVLRLGVTTVLWASVRVLFVLCFGLGLVQIKKAGCTVLLVQKSILRDAYNDLSIHFLAKVRESSPLHVTVDTLCFRFLP